MLCALAWMRGVARHECVDALLLLGGELAEAQIAQLEGERI